jgi:hypothetical protein
MDEQIDGQIELPHVMKSEGFVLFRVNAEKDGDQVGPINKKNVTSSVLWKHLPPCDTHTNGTYLNHSEPNLLHSSAHKNRPTL